MILRGSAYHRPLERNNSTQTARKKELELTASASDSAEDVVEVVVAVAVGMSRVESHRIASS